MVINVLEFLEKSAELFPEKTALEDEFGSLTYSEYISKAKKIAAYLLDYALVELMYLAVLLKHFDEHTRRQKTIGRILPPCKSLKANKLSVGS